MTEGTAAYETFRPRRSVLYLPASNARALEKARTLPVDSVILDLEDAVATDAKDAARESACAAVQSGGFGHRELVVRVNGIGTAWHEADVAGVCAAGPDAVLVPKVSSPRDVDVLVSALAAARAPDHTTLWAMIETPTAVLHAEQIGCASDRLTCLVLGTNDLNKELGVSVVPGRTSILTAISLVVLGARASGKVVLDGVFNDVRDADGFRAECEQGRALGFDGKTLIHPGQVDPCNAVFSPSTAEVDHARAVIEAFEAASAQGRAVATLDGRMVEQLHADSARHVLLAADAIAARQG